ncbi:cytochrome P450 [Saccharothrix australiensis]|uniref:Cytochrome P450 n=1 Tax=Saccharothrix australiensis TaxID=2072 RepID=A0A495W3Q6_9PSEU|nr:cytochrome P450 [Saccharothrix australiensis]
MLFGEGYWDNADEVHARLRDRLGSPWVVNVMLPGLCPVWVLGGSWESVRSALADRRLAKDVGLVGATIVRKRAEAGLPPLDGPLPAMFRQTALFSDGDLHVRQRRLLGENLTADRVQRMVPRIEHITDALLAGLDLTGPVDLVREFAFPLPLTVICELLGIPEVDRDGFRAMTAALMQDDPLVARPASQAMQRFFADLVAAKRARPGPDLTSSLLDAGDQEVIDHLILLFVAGHETTTNLIANAIEALAGTGAWDDLAADPGLIPRAVDEVLRHTSPVRHATHRVTVEPLAYGDVTIPAGELVMVSLASANRDPDKFDRPDEMRPHRDARGHVAFGHGPHFCWGALLGRREAEVALHRLVTGYRAARPPGPVRCARSAIMRGPERLLVTLTPR